MNELNKAAETVRTSWCQGDFRREAESRDQGDAYCAAGALALNVISEDKRLTGDGAYIGTIDEVNAYDAAYKKYRDSVVKTANRNRIEIDECRQDYLRARIDMIDTQNFLDKSPAIRALAEVIVENYNDNFVRDARDEDCLSIVFYFNDDIAQDRSEVVAMMEKAAVRLDEQRDLV